MTARRVRIEDIINGDYHEREGFDPNFLITPRGMRVSRASLVATVVDSFVNDDESYGSFTLDDGTETIRAKFFQELDDMEGIEEGDIVHVVGKVREYDDEIYVQPELIKTENMEYELLHALETQHLHNKWQKAVNKAKEMQDNDRSEEDIRQELKGLGIDSDEDIDAILEYLSAEEQFETASETEGGSSSQERSSGGSQSEGDRENQEQLVLHAIDELDDGEGADYSDIIERVDMSEDEVEDVINDLLSDGTCYEPKPGRIKKL
ncbi:MAG: OB-fold nucleic acid binding domain-containing protein [Candidatus Nanohaloarchaea archaeon]|nr:OB-fold nucleic acid binding domain-containing protein [Candidatus Nanohaloarchaea archaeon]